LRVGIGVGFLLLWELLAILTGRGELLGQPTLFFRRLATDVADGSILYHSAVTASEMLAGLTLGAAAGVTVGLLLIIAPTRLKKVVNLYIIAFYCLPKIAIVPLFILWFGIGWSSKVYFVSMISFFFMFLAVHEGAKHPPVHQLQQVALMGASKVQQLRFVYGPHLMRWVVGGLKMTIPYSLTYAVSAELIASREGVGNVILRAAGAADLNRIVAALAAVLVLAAALNSTGLALERRVRK
jgi:NitT/TauT family transport system permease protein